VKVIKCLGLADGRDGPAGYYLSDYDPETGGSTWGTKADALTFPDLPAAMARWQSVHALDPVRPDGKPNRPLTAFTVTFEDTDA
jgi:hypothetical protein